LIKSIESIESIESLLTLYIQSIFLQKAEKLIEFLQENVLLPMEGSAAIISVDTCTGRAFPVITVRVDCAGQSFRGDIFLKVTSSMILSHEHVFDMSKGDSILYGGGVSDEEHSIPRLKVHFGGSSDIISQAVSEGLIKDGFGVVTVFDNVSGDEKKN